MTVRCTKFPWGHRQRLCIGSPIWSEDLSFQQQRPMSSPALAPFSRVIRQLLGDGLSAWRRQWLVHTRIDTLVPSFLSMFVPELKPMYLVSAFFSATVCHTALLLKNEPISQQNKRDNGFMPMDSCPRNLPVFPCITLHWSSWPDRWGNDLLKSWSQCQLG